MKTKIGSNRIVNKKSGFNYEIMEKYEAGLNLLGTEAKSLRLGHGRLDSSYITLSSNGEAFLIKAKIPAYQPANAPTDYNEERPRKILMKKKELNELMRGTSEKGLTLIPLAIYPHGKFLKIEFALARKKKKHDKKSALRQADLDREAEREIKNYK